MKKKEKKVKKRTNYSQIFARNFINVLKTIDIFLWLMALKQRSRTV